MDGLVISTLDESPRGNSETVRDHSRWRYLADLSKETGRQLDLLLNDDKERRKCEKITHMMDGLNRKFGKWALTLGAWTPPPGGYTGGKIAFNRIPSAEDFW